MFMDDSFSSLPFMSTVVIVSNGETFYFTFTIDQSFGVDFNISQAAALSQFDILQDTEFDFKQ